MNLSLYFSKNSIRSQTTHFPLGTVIFHPGQPGDVFYILWSGRMRVLVQDADGRSETLGYLYPGDHFGEGALLTGKGHRATVRAVEDSEVMVVPRDEFFKVLKKDPELKAYLEDQVENIAYRNFTRFLKGGSDHVSGGVMQELFACLKREEVESEAMVVERGLPGERFYLVGRGQL